MKRSYSFKNNYIPTKRNPIFFHIVHSFKTGMEPGLICYQCVSTHPGCGLYDFDSRWYWGKICPRSDDRCVKLIEKKGADIMVTRDCLSNLEAHRVDIPADKYEGCRAATPEIKLGQYTFNTIKELDTKRYVPTMYLQKLFLISRKKIRKKNLFVKYMK